MPDWAKQAIPQAETIWAPDISFFNGQYWLYYAVSTFGSNRSVIGLATTATLNRADANYGWQDRGLVLESHKSDDFNALDPNRIIDHDGKHWLAFGSFWTGLKIIAARSCERYAAIFRSASQPGAPAQAAGCDRGGVHHPARRQLLPVRLVRFLLPRRR